MKINEKEKYIVEKALYKLKEDLYVLWHAGESNTKKYEESSLAIESIKKKMWKSKVKYEVDDQKKAFDDLTTHLIYLLNIYNERFIEYGEDD
jgi:hypothetical protein